MILDYDDSDELIIMKRIRPIMLTQEEMQEKGAEEASITLLNVLRNELNSLESQKVITHNCNRFVYGHMLDTAIKKRYVGHPLLRK